MKIFTCLLTLLVIFPLKGINQFSNEKFLDAINYKPSVLLFCYNERTVEEQRINKIVSYIEKKF